MTLKRLTAAFLIILAITILFGRLGRSALRFDEAIYAQVSKEMIERGEWLTPHWNGQLWFHKSPVFFWLTALFFKLFSIDEFWARFASALSGMGVLLLSYLIARRIYDRGAGVLAVLILLSTQLFVFYARFGATDTMLTLFVLLSAYAYLKTEDDERFWLLVGAACAMALMVKGAAGAIAPLVLLLTALVERNLLESLRSKWLWLGAGLGLLIVLPWHVFMYQRHGEAFLNGYVFSHVINRARSNLNEYQRGYGYYFSVLRNYFSPWVFILPFALLLKRGRRSAIVVILGLTVFILYTVVQTKFQWYILPAIPAFAIVVAGFITSFSEYRTRLQRKIIALVLIGLWAFATYGVLRLVRTVNPDIQAAARLAKQATRDRGGLMAYPEHMEMTVLFYSNRKLCTDPVISKLSHRVTTECAPTELKHIILRKSDWDKIEGSFTITPLIEDGPLTYASISRR
ncbi:MAG TPA: glycosyltransferase family 39 protein [Pyrinomonadaceae bacterium]|nr:glycosyltransferase family 39 protein [Pyrinomonadaceae bacterium]